MGRRDNNMRQQNIDKLNKFRAGIYYLALTVELLVMLVEISALPPLPEGQLFRLTILLFAIKICITQYSGKEWLWLVASGLMGGAFYWHTGENILLHLVVFVAAMKGIALRPVLKYVFMVTLGGCLLLVTLAVLGVLGDVRLTQEFRQGIVETRFSLGLGHPNGLHCMFLMLLLLFMYLYRDGLSSWVLALLFGGNLLLFMLSGSKNGFGIAALAIIAALILKKGPKLQKSAGIYILGIVIFIGCIGISVWAAQSSESTFSNPLMEMIDRVFSGRIKNLYWNSGVHAGALVSWRLFSAPEHFSYYFDMGWVRMFYWFGILPGIFFAVMQVLLLGECGRKKDGMGMLMLVTLAVYTIMEAHIISVYPARNYLLLLFGAYGSDMLRAGGGRPVYFWQAPAGFINRHGPALKKN